MGFPFAKAWIAKYCQQQYMEFYHPSEYLPMGEEHWPSPDDPVAAAKEMANERPAELEQFLAAHANVYQPRIVRFDNAGAQPAAQPVMVILPSRPYVVELGESPEIKPASEWLLDIYDHNLGYYVPYQDFNKQFWDGVGRGSVMYHATDTEHMDAIKVEGLHASYGTRGLSNQNMGDAVFTSSEPEAVNSYGPVLLSINVAAMKADGYMPTATKEEPFEDSEMRATLACKVGLSDYCPYSQYAHEGLDQNTVAFYGDIPAKYISVVRQPRMATTWLLSSRRFAQASQYDSVYPVAGSMVDGRQVMGPPQNQDSIAASLDDWEVLPGVREVNFSMFPEMGSLSYYSPQEKARTQGLANQIRASGQVTPLIVVVDQEGPYVLEGGHRFDALRELGAKSFPAMVVIDTSRENIAPIQAWVHENCRFAGQEAMTIRPRALFGWRPKVDEAIEDIRQGRLSMSVGEPIVVSKLDSIRGGWFVMDGHHRAIEMIVRGVRSVPCVMNPHVPFFERPMEANRSMTSDMVRLVDMAKGIHVPNDELNMETKND